MKLTKNFTLEEMACKDGTPVPAKYIPNAERLAKNLQALRDHLNEPVMITGSAYRTAAHNKKVGGAKKSQHLTCSGADINVKSMYSYELAEVVEDLIASGVMEQGGIGIYAGFLHYDFRGTKARW